MKASARAIVPRRSCTKSSKRIVCVGWPCAAASSTMDTVFSQRLKPRSSHASQGNDDVILQLPPAPTIPFTNVLHVGLALWKLLRTVSRFLSATIALKGLRTRCRVLLNVCKCPLLTVGHNGSACVFTTTTERLLNPSPSKPINFSDKSKYRAPLQTPVEEDQEAKATHVYEVTTFFLS